MIYISEKGQFNFEDYFTVKEFVKEEIPSSRVSKQYVIGRNGAYTFNDGFNDIQLTMVLEHYNASIAARMADIQAMKAIILRPGFFISSAENNIIYTCNVETASTDNINGILNSFSVTITAKPIANSRLTAELAAWEDINIPWDLINIPWLLIGEGFEFSVADETIEVTNYGNIEALPIIKINASTNITMTLNGVSFTYTGYENSIYINCNDLTVYNSSTVNKIANFSGDFLTLETGVNSIAIVGTADIEFVNKDVYI